MFNKVKYKTWQAKANSDDNLNVSAAVKAVVRVIAISTTAEDQQQRNVSLFCICNYNDGRPAVVSRLLQTPSPIGYICDV